jgi:hypothetical protein
VPAAADGARAVIVVKVERIADSCGFGVPLMRYERQRAHQLDWMERKLRQHGDDALMDYVAEKNELSIDGLPAFEPATLPRPRRAS